MFTWFHQLVSRKCRRSRSKRRPTIWRRLTCLPWLEPLEARVAFSVRTWTGLGVNHLWSNPNNWQGGIVPVADDDLVFPALNEGSKDSIDNFDRELELRSIRLDASGYHLEIIGNASIRLPGSGPALISNATGLNTFNIPLNLQPFCSGTACYFDHQFGVVGNGTLDLQSQIVGAPIANSLHKTGPGRLILDYGPNDYGGSTDVTGGTLQVGANFAIPGGLDDVFIAPGATIDLADHLDTFASLSGDPGAKLILGSGSGGTLTVGDNSLFYPSTTFAGNISGTGSLIANEPGTLTLTGTNSYTGNLIVDGPGMLILTGTNSYTGYTQVVNQGTLQMGTSNALPLPTAVTVEAGAALDLNNYDTQMGSLAGAGAVTLGFGTLFTGADNSDTTFSGAISGSGDVHKLGTGVWTLAGNSNYTGTTWADNGTLIVDGSLSASSVTVGPGTLEGLGTVLAVDVQNLGTIIPGDPGQPGTLTVTQTANFEGGSFFKPRLTASGYDQLNADTVDLTGGFAVLAINPINYTPSPGDQFNIIVANNVIGNFFNLADGTTFFVNGAFYRINYGPGGVILTVVP
jgi:autotransporter-associated beta strand protein